MQDPYEMTDHEMLMELIREKRRNDIRFYIQLAITAITVIVVVITAIRIVPAVANTMQQLSQLSATIEQIGDKASSLTSAFSEDALNNLNKAIENINKIAELFGR